MLAQLIVSGIAVGCVYALIALGMTILFRSTTIVNFCHGEFFMLGAFAVLVPCKPWAGAMAGACCSPCACCSRRAWPWKEA